MSENDALLCELIVQQAEAKARYKTLTKLIDKLQKESNIITSDTLGSRIREARIAAKYTQKELGILVGYGAGAGISIHRVEANGVIPRADKIDRLAEVLELDASLLHELADALRTDENETINHHS